MIKNRIPIPIQTYSTLIFSCISSLGENLFYLSKSAVIFANSIDIFKVLDYKCNIPKYLSL